MTPMVDYSIIVPLLGRLSDFEDTLASVLRHRPKNSQILVAHDGRYNDPYDLRKEVEFVFGGKNNDLAGLLNQAIPAVLGEFTIVVRPGMDIDEGFEQPLAESFADARVAAVCPVIVSESRPGRLVAAGVDCDRTCTRALVGHGLNLKKGSVESLASLGPTSWLGAYRSDALKLVAPFDERIDSVFLDLEISLALKGLGLRSTLNSEFVGTLASEAALVAESCTPHGLSAERAKIRHRLYFGTSTVRTCLLEATQIARSPWKLKHLTQRIGARKLRALDELYCRTIQSKRETLASTRLGFPSSKDLDRFKRAA